MSKFQPFKPELQPGTLLMHELLRSGKVYKREFIIVVQTFIDTQGDEPAGAYHGFSSIEGRTTRFSAPIYAKPKPTMKALGRWTILVL